MSRVWKLVLPFPAWLRLGASRIGGFAQHSLSVRLSLQLLFLFSAITLSVAISNSARALALAYDGPPLLLALSCFDTTTTLKNAPSSKEAAIWWRVTQPGTRLSGSESTRSLDDALLAARGTAQLTGQMHHGISRTIHKAVEQHPNLKGLCTARDSRFVTQAKDLASHRGYDTFHRNLDAEIAGWIRSNPNATQAQFEGYLRGVYQRPDVLAHFPNGR